MRYYDEENKRLIFLKEKANGHFWDKHWDKHGGLELIKASLPANTRFHLKITEKFLHRGSKILEGGCGIGSIVYCLHINGYNCIGIDYASETIKKVNDSMPGLRIFKDDVRKLSFPDMSFDGYWSNGVIEHYYTGFKDIANEMFRVLKRDGFLFLSFPYMSYIRRLKGNKGMYPLWNEGKYSSDSFYQFALNSDTVKSTFESIGFNFVNKKNTSGLLGLIEELPVLNFFLNKIYHSKSLSGKVLKYPLNLVLSPFFGHSQLMVFKKVNK